MARTVTEVSVEGVQKRKTPKKHVVYAIKVTWSDGTVNVIYRTYKQFQILEECLLNVFSDEAKDNNGKSRTIPRLQGKESPLALKSNPRRKWDWIDNFSMGYLHFHQIVNLHHAALAVYLTSKNLVDLPSAISECDIIEEFFTPKPEDLISSKRRKLEERQEKTYKKKHRRRPHLRRRTTIKNISSPVLMEEYRILEDYEQIYDKDITLAAGRTVHVMEKRDDVSQLRPAGASRKMEHVVHTVQKHEPAPPFRPIPRIQRTISFEDELKIDNMAENESNLSKADEENYTKDLTDYDEDKHDYELSLSEASSEATEQDDDAAENGEAESEDYEHDHKSAHCGEPNHQLFHEDFAAGDILQNPEAPFTAILDVQQLEKPESKVKLQSFSESFLPLIEIELQTFGRVDKRSASLDIEESGYSDFSSSSRTSTDEETTVWHDHQNSQKTSTSQFQWVDDKEQASSLSKLKTCCIQNNCSEDQETETKDTTTPSTDIHSLGHEGNGRFEAVKQSEDMCTVANESEEKATLIEETETGIKIITEEDTEQHDMAKITDAQGRSFLETERVLHRCYSDPTRPAKKRQALDENPSLTLTDKIATANSLPRSATVSEERNDKLNEIIGNTTDRDGITSNLLAPDTHEERSKTSPRDTSGEKKRMRGSISKLVVKPKPVGTRVDDDKDRLPEHGSKILHTYEDLRNPEQQVLNGNGHKTRQRFFASISYDDYGDQDGCESAGLQSDNSCESGIYTVDSPPTFSPPVLLPNNNTCLLHPSCPEENCDRFVFQPLTYFAIASYEAEGDLEASFSEGEEVKVLRKAENGWWMVKIGDERGWAPSNYLEQGPSNFHRVASRAYDRDRNENILGASSPLMSSDKAKYIDSRGDLLGSSDQDAVQVEDHGKEGYSLVRIPSMYGWVPSERLAISQE